MSKKLCIFTISLLILFSFFTAMARGQEDSRLNVKESIKEILNSINAIIKSGIRLAEVKLKELQKEVLERNDSLQDHTEKSIVQGLQKILSELKKLEKALEKDLNETQGLSKEHTDQYLEMEEKLAQFKKEMGQLSEEIKEKSRLMKASMRRKSQDILNGIERTISRIEEMLKTQRQIDETTSI